MNLVDRMMRHSAQLGIPNVGGLVLGSSRARALAETLALFGPRVNELVPGLTRDNDDARTALGALADEALRDMRARTRNLAAHAGVVPRTLVRLDAWWAGTDQGEYIDDPSLDPALRQRAMAHLDQINGLVGSYEMFFQLLRPAMVRVRDRPLRIIDLAAGHGGFALSVARHARGLGQALEITATDIKPEYLDIGAAAAREQGLSVAFEVQDALDLSNIEPGRFDVVVCTQSLHHFPAGAVARMIQEATRAAGHYVLFIDGARTLMLALPLYAYIRGRRRDPILAHDAWVSCRRFFAPEELLLLARLGPWGEHAEVETLAAFMSALAIPTTAH